MNKFKDLVNLLVKNPSTELIHRLINIVEKEKTTDEDLAYLAIRLAESGEVISSSRNYKTADIASTGGPSSLSTLICPLYLRAFGFTVPKLTVPGRPAGGIDILAQIPGYRIEFSKLELKSLLRKHGYIHFLALHNFTPLDASLFLYRKKEGKVNIPGLAIASILAKKKAAGVSLVGLEIRVGPYGSFGQTILAAGKNAGKFIRVASLLGIHALCFLTDGSRPYQQYIGRGEALVAISHILTSCADSWLKKHDDMCYAMAHRLSLFEHSNKSVSRPSPLKLFNVFRKNLEAQGASYELFSGYVSEIQNHHKYNLVASKPGFLNIDLIKLRDLIVKIQQLTSSETTPFSDPCGVIIKHDHGTFIHKGEIIATIRCEDRFANQMVDAAEVAFRVDSDPVSMLLFQEVVHG